LSEFVINFVVWTHFAVLVYKAKISDLGRCPSVARIVKVGASGIPEGVSDKAYTVLFEGGQRNLDKPYALFIVKLAPTTP
jgi:hypothetical protein